MQTIFPNFHQKLLLHEKQVTFGQPSANLRPTVLAVLILLLFSKIGAQSLFSSANVNAQALTNAQLVAKSVYENSSQTAQFEFVDIGNPLSLQQNGVINVTMPGTSGTWPFKTKRVSVNPNGDYEWYATMLDTPDSLTGYIYLTRVGQLTYGSVEIDSMFWDVRSLGNNLPFIRKKTPTPVGSGADCLVTGSGSGSTSSGGPSEDDIESFDRTVCEVDVVACYTVGALAIDPMVEQTIKTAVADLNGNLKDSKVNNLHFNLVLTHALTNAEFAEGNVSAQNDADNIATNPTIAGPNGLRNANHADIVMVFEDDTHVLEALGNVTVVGLDATFEDRAFGWVNTNAAVSNHSFSHESAHLFGCRHNWNPCPNGANCGGDNAGPFAHGHYWEKTINTPDKGYRSIMSVPLNTYKRMGFFSNPDVKHRGKKTGSGTSNNARKLREEACRVSEYRSIPQPPGTGTQMTLLISGPQVICPNEPIVVKGTLVTDYPPPYTFIWSTSLNYGQTWQVQKTVQSTTAKTDIFTTYPAMPVGEQVFIRLEAGTVAGLHKIASHAVQTLNPAEPHTVCPHSFEPNGQSEDTETRVFRAYPNPTISGDFETVFSLPKAQDCSSLDLFSNDGRFIQNLIGSGALEKTEVRYFSLPSFLPPGVYQLRLKLDKSVVVQRIVLVR